MPRADRRWPRREAEARVGNLRLHYAAWGPRSTPPLLLLHGGAANSHWWDWVAPDLAGDFQVFALDFPGHGQSRWPRPPRYRMQDFVAAVVGFVKALGISRLDLVGHSMGGKVGMLVAARRPRLVDRLVIVDAAPDVSDDGLAEMRRIATRPLRLFPTRQTAARTFRLIPPETVASPARLRALATRSAWCWGRGRWSIGPDREFFGRVIPQVAWPVLPRIHCPTLVLRAERSSILSHRTAARMRDAIPRASLLEVPDTYHHLTLERPRRVAGAIRRFLTGHPWS
ncbi:MAG: alpha/beta fold hydrolase [Candidatus Methylomirabilota bacterium]